MPSEKAMSFWGFFHDDDGAAAPDMEEFPYLSDAGPGVLTSSPPADGAGRDRDRDRGGGGGSVKVKRSASVAENDSRSGIDHLDTVVSAGVDFGAEDAAEPGRPGKRNRTSYGRHTPDQIRELQAFFRRCSHPDDKQRAALAKKLGLRPIQVKFWFQNRRTHFKREALLDENAQLQKENDKLRAENVSIRGAMMHQVCGGCAHPSPAILRGSASRQEEEDLRVQNASLRAELSRFCALASKLLGKSISLLAPGECIGSVPVSATVANSTVTEFTAGCSSMAMTKAGIDKFVLTKLAASAMDELVKMAHMDEPLWTPGVPLPGSLAKGTLNHEEYLNIFSPCITGARTAGFVSEASRESGIVISESSAALVETLMDERRWSRMFSCIIAKSSTMEEISAGVAGSRDGALLLVSVEQHYPMQAELCVLSPLVPAREVTFLRFCKQLSDRAWAVVDVSIDGLVMEQGLAVEYTTANMRCRRLPSGCVVQDTANGLCKVTWIEHTEYDESSVHQLYRPLLRSGLALGAGRWFATLQRQCEGLDILMPSVAAPKQDSSDVMVDGARSLLKLAQRMMENFRAGVSTSSAAWSKLDGFTGNIGEDVRVMARQSVDEPGVPPGVVLCAATSVWMLVTPKRLFNFLCNEETRAEWDILSKSGPMQELTKIAKGQQDGNAVSLLKANATDLQDSSILILQETCTDASGSMVVYAPVDIPAMRLLMDGGGDPRLVALLPSGFVVLPAGPSISGDEHKACGSLLTVAFQILVNSSQPTGKLTMESVQTVKTLISCTINRIKTALQCNDV
ncbi:homeobox-leucine zipper protein ROC4-like [Lolium rigidum]|uniref:homeobox-leucine zipper protein ROC4-like n=1 Tax=Lolium rigidum TaxID=89674 RepID=UPI001F5C6826|nr:homeobox-leucine zipper protein ROC4-like [Lolium rigidum]